MKTLAYASTIVLALAACSQQQINNVQNTIASDAPKLVDDGLVYAKVESALVSIDPNSAMHVAVAVHGGVVSLSGRVKTSSTQQRFISSAEKVSGVSRVASTVRVDPSLPNPGKEADDFALATAVRAALTAQAGVNGIGLGIVSKNGVVTLTGPVKTAALRDTIVATARKTHGVRSVVDRLHEAS